MKTQSIGREKALKMHATQWWLHATPKEIAKFQLMTNELCCPFAVFHEALEKTLGRPVWTHEIAMNRDGLIQEMFGEADPPTMEEIIGLIPKEKLLIIAP